MRVPSPRLLPVTIAAMAVLLAVKSTALVRAAVPEATHAAAAEKPAMKAEAPPPAKPAEPKPAEPKPEQDGVAAAPPEPPVSESERALLLDLRRRRTELEAREAALSAREGLMAATEKRLTARVDELTALQSRLEALEKSRAERDETNWAGLVKMYEAMKPRDAAVIFNDLEMPVLLQVVDRMKETKAAPVLAAMQADRARQITAQLAQFRARANAAPRAGG